MRQRAHVAGTMHESRTTPPKAREKTFVMYQLLALTVDQQIWKQSVYRVQCLLLSI